MLDCPAVVEWAGICETRKAVVPVSKKGHGARCVAESWVLGENLVKGKNLVGALGAGHLIHLPSQKKLKLF